MPEIPGGTRVTLPAPSRSRSRRAPFTGEGETLDGATAIVTGAGYGSPYSFTVASRAALADPAKAAAIRDYLSLLAQAHRWASTHLSAWAAVWSGPRPAGCRLRSCGRLPPTPLRSRYPSRPQWPPSGSRSPAFTASGLILVHVNFSQFAGRVIQRHGECLMRKDAP